MNYIFLQTSSTIEQNNEYVNVERVFCNKIILHINFEHIKHELEIKQIINNDRLEGEKDVEIC